MVSFGHRRLFVRYRVGSVDELRHEGCRIVSVEGRGIGILSVAGEFFAVRNRCPHRGAPLCAGTVGGTFLPSAPNEYRYGMENRVLRCPWHGWEFDLATGKSLFQPDEVRVKVYRVTVEDGDVFLHV
jgi:nitrite reductase (NADH) small subunit